MSKVAKKVPHKDHLLQGHQLSLPPLCTVHHKSHVVHVDPHCTPHILSTNMQVTLPPSAFHFFKHFKDMNNELKVTEFILEQHIKDVSNNVCT